MEDTLQAKNEKKIEKISDKSFIHILPPHISKNDDEVEDFTFNIEVEYNSDLKKLEKTIYKNLQEQLKLKENYIEWGISILSETGIKARNVASVSLLCDLNNIKENKNKTCLLSYNIAYQEIKNGKIIKNATSDFPLHIKITQKNVIHDSATLALNLNAINIPYLDLYLTTAEAFGLQSKIYYIPMPGNPTLPGYFCVK
ncbi:hypothetical protein [Spiroplasma endosymbiont of Nebria brevicollis]|uniref:hypothetical protein n=1 Tax=Spiroplasma endosymbiont of Nebria brevicollis TaxID=3066284 RepID=UPI00313B1092